jgi:hypothetical protein
VLISQTAKWGALKNATLASKEDCPVKLIINNQESIIATAGDMERACDAVRQRYFSEVWLEVSDNGPSLAMFVNGKDTLLMYLPGNGVVLGFTSRNPAYTGVPDARIEFMLANGQMDEYPAQWTVPLSVGCAVCRDFIERQGTRSPLITWHDDNKPDDEW